MQFATQLRHARIVYAIIMATCTCVIMSAVSTSLLAPMHEFWNHWPRVLGIDLVIAIPLAILLGPPIRRICHRIYPQIAK